MSSPEWALQAALRGVLSANDGVKSLLGDPARIYDEPRGDLIFPYLTYGRSECLPFDGDDQSVVEQILHLHVWSQYGGRKEAKRAVAAVRSALQDLVLTADGYHHSNVRATYTDVFRVGDGRTTQGVVRIRALTEPDAS